MTALLINPTSVTGDIDASGCSPWAAAGILVVGGGYYGTPYSVNVRIMNNILTGNDVGVFAWQGESDLSLPTNTQTNLKVVGNKIDGTGAANLCGYDGLSHPYMFGISDYGVNDKLINNSVTVTPTTRHIPGVSM